MTTRRFKRPDRAGASNLNFFNVESDHNGAFASYGVADFHGSDFGFGGSVTAINSVQLMLTESNAAFSTPGALQFYLSHDTTTFIDNTGGSPAFFDHTMPPTGLGTQFDPKALVHSDTFNTTGNVNTGQVDTYTLTLTPADQTYLINQLNTGGPIRVIVAAGDDLVAATYAGFNNNTLSGPQLAIDAVVPEPATLGLLAFSLPMLAARRRSPAGR